MPKFSLELFLACLAIAVAAVLYILEKSGKSGPLINTALLILIAVLLIFPALSILWVSSPTAWRVWWMVSAVCTILLAVSAFGLWTWPNPTRTAISAPEPEPPSEGPMQSIPRARGTENSSHPSFSKKFNTIFITAGNNTMSIPNVEGSRAVLFALKADGSIGFGMSSPAGKDTPIIAYISNGRLCIDAEVFAAVDQPPVEIRNSELLERPAKWDENTDDNKRALEIVNEDGLPVLQMIYLDEARVMIKGVFVNGEAVAIVDKGILAGRKLEAFQHPIKRIFKYPSWKYPGVFEE